MWSVLFQLRSVQGMLDNMLTMSTQSLSKYSSTESQVPQVTETLRLVTCALLLTRSA